MKWHSDAEIAFYKGDTFIKITTIKDLALELNVKEDTVRFYGSASYQARGTGENRRLILLMEE